ncbi:GSCFA domain-containing protein, partial [Acinetobacter baumannii]
ACEEVSHAFGNVQYFPAYEIVTGPYSEGFFEADRRSVSQLGIQTVMDALFQHSELPSAPAGQTLRDRIKMAEQLSRRLSERECEEVASDRSSA